MSSAARPHVAVSTPVPPGWHNPLRDKRDKRMPRIAGPCGVVIFGVTGDLSRKKLMPAIYDLANRGLLPPTFALVGFARRDWADEDFGKIVYDAVKQHARTPFRQEVWDRLSEGFRLFRAVSTTTPRSPSCPKPPTSSASNAAPAATTPSTCPSRRRPSGGLRTAEAFRAGRPRGRPGSRVVIEKPFGHDLASAKELNRVVNSVFPRIGVPHRPLPR